MTTILHDDRAAHTSNSAVCDERKVLLLSLAVNEIRATDFYWNNYSNKKQEWAYFRPPDCRRRYAAKEVNIYEIIYDKIIGSWVYCIY